MHSCSAGGRARGRAWRYTVKPYKCVEAGHGRWRPTGNGRTRESANYLDVVPGPFYVYSCTVRSRRIGYTRALINGKVRPFPNVQSCIKRHTMVYIQYQSPFTAARPAGSSFDLEAYSRLLRARKSVAIACSRATRPPVRRQVGQQGGGIQSVMHQQRQGAQGQHGTPATASLTTHCTFASAAAMLFCQPCKPGVAVGQKRCLTPSHR